MTRSNLWLAPVLMSAALVLAGCNSDYLQGYRQGQKEVEQLRKEFGGFAKPLHNVVDGLGIEPHMDGKSDAWNRGYREGIRDAMKK